MGIGECHTPQKVCHSVKHNHMNTFKILLIAMIASSAHGDAEITHHARVGNKNKEADNKYVRAWQRASGV